MRIFIVLREYNADPDATYTTVDCVFDNYDLAQKYCDLKNPDCSYIYYRVVSEYVLDRLPD